MCICTYIPIMSEDVSRTDETLYVNIGALLQFFPERDRKIVRNIETTRKKLINALYASSL